MLDISQIAKARYYRDITSPSGLRNRFSYNLRKGCKAGKASGRLLDGVYIVTINNVNYSTDYIKKLISN